MQNEVPGLLSRRYSRARMHKGRALLWNTVAAMIVCAASFACAEELTTKAQPFVPSTKYATTRVAGWTVRVNRELLTTKAELGSNALALLAVHLREITNTVP